MRINELIPWSRRTGAVARQEDNPLLVLQRDINRVFDEFWKRFEQPRFGLLSDAAGGALPRVEVAETDKEVEISAELPGMDEKDIELSLTDNLLTIKGEKKQEREETKKGYHISERTYGSFFRSVPLPPGIQAENVSATYKKGVLTVTLPKSPEAQSRAKKIEVKAA